MKLKARPVLHYYQPICRLKVSQLSRSRLEWQVVCLPDWVPIAWARHSVEKAGSVLGANRLGSSQRGEGWKRVGGQPSVLQRDARA